MKYILTIFCLLLVAARGDPTAKPTADVERKVANLLIEVIKISKDATNHLTNEEKEYYLKRENQLKQMHNYLSDINRLRDISKTCVARQDKKISEAINNMFYNKAICGAKADNTSAIKATGISEPKKEAQDCALRAANSAIIKLIDIRESIYGCTKIQ